jgi:hypothetical protein
MVVCVRHSGGTCRKARHPSPPWGFGPAEKGKPMAVLAHGILKQKFGAIE